MYIRFTVHGKPQPQGSTRAFIPRGWNRAVITTDNKKLKPWRQDVTDTAMLEMNRTGEKMTEGAVHMECFFYFMKPKSAGKKVVHKITKPDLDKLLRGIFDGLTGIAFRDDSQVVSCEMHKLFCESDERVEVIARDAE